MSKISEFREALSVRLSVLDIKPLVQSIEQHPEEFSEMIRLTTDNNQTISWRAYWVCEKLSERHPEWFIPLQEELIERLLTCSHDGSKRLLLSILFNLPATEPLSVRLLNFSFDRMLLPSESIAVQALCIKIAYRLCLSEPELLDELRRVLESAEPELFSAGVASTLRNTLKRIYQTTKTKQ